MLMPTATFLVAHYMLLTISKPCAAAVSYPLKDLSYDHKHCPTLSYAAPDGSTKPGPQHSIQSQHVAQTNKKCSDFVIYN